jgi:lipoprotein-anchoring transpeptidase ErfK/SrfK
MSTDRGPGSLRRRGATAARLAAAGLCAAAGLAVAPGSAAAARPSANASRADTILSNETTTTIWTVPNVVAPIRTQPSPTARRLDKLRLTTPDGYLQSYVLLRERFTPSGPWVQLRIPGRPNGRIGWVSRSALNTFQTVHTQIVVDRAKRTLTVYRGGHKLFSAPVGVGKPSTPTPPGHFWVTEGFPSFDPFYGPYLLATSDYSVLTDWPRGGIVGIHGTNEPSLVPGDPSHGCIRMHNPDILRVKSVVSTGTPILIK